LANEEPSGRADAARLGRESRRRLAKGAADSHSLALIGAGTVMVTVGGIFMVVTALESLCNGYTLTFIASSATKD
jgi:hypothetical protein